MPATAKRVTVRVTALQGSGQGNLRLYRGDASDAPAGILRFGKGQTRAATFDLPLAANGTLAVLPFVRGNGTVQVIVEINGYTL